MPVNFRYRKLGYVALTVTDIERSTDFLTNILGLDHVAEDAGDNRFFRLGTFHHDVVLTQGEVPAFQRSGWHLESEDDLDKAFAHFSALGLKPSWLDGAQANALFLERAFRVREPINGVEHEYFATMTETSVPLKNTLTSFQGGTHFGLTVPDVKKTSDWMTENMGFLVSDYLEGWPVALMRAFPNPNHHSFAPLRVPSSQLGFHHVAFMVNSIDDIGRMINRIKRFDIKTQFGVGRHPTSGSIHIYIYDDDFLVWEYTLGMEQFPETGARQARRMSARPENFDMWGATPDMEFAGRHAKVITG